MTLFAGIDGGTSGCRCLIVDEQGRRKGYGERAWRYLGDGMGMRELDPAAGLAALAEACKEALSSCAPQDISAVGVTAQRFGMVLLDDDGEALAAIPVDGRATREGLEQERAHGDLIYRVAGRLPAMLFIAPRIVWFRANRPDDYRRARWVLSFSDWIVHRLTGSARTDPTQAAEMLCYDVARGQWSDELISALEVPASLLPPIVAPGEPAGAVNREAAATFGFPEDVPVFSAGGDTHAASLAMGLIEPGQASVVAGASALCQQGRKDAGMDPEGRLWTGPHLVPGRFVQEVHCTEVGWAVSWLAGLLQVTPADLASLAQEASPGAGGVTFTGTWPTSARDFVLARSGGFTFPVPVAALGRRREDFARALFEGLAFAARAGLDWLEECNGVPDVLTVAGGVARAEVFCAALAGASERPVVVPTEHASSALGAAIVAAAAHHGGVEQAARAMHDGGRELAPVPSHGYPAQYAAWKNRAAAFASDAMYLSRLME